MAERGRPRNPDASPAGSLKDGRVWCYPSGYANVGEKKWKRCGSAEAAEIEAKRLADELIASRNVDAAGAGSLTRRSPIADALELWLETLAQTKGESTFKTRRAHADNWISLIGGNTGEQMCSALFLAPLEEAVAKTVAVSTFNGIQTSLKMFLSWGQRCRFFPLAACAPDNELRENIKGLRRDLRKKRADAGAVKVTATATATSLPTGRMPDAAGRLSIDDVPQWRHIEALADGIAQRESNTDIGGPLRSSKGGRRPLDLDVSRQLAASIPTRAATGLRPAETLVLHTSAIDAETGEVRVDWQYDRSRLWLPGEAPPLTLPKHDRQRVTQCWSFYLPQLRELIKWADEHAGGWLFAPVAGQRRWLDAYECAIRRGVDHLAAEHSRWKAAPELFEDGEPLLWTWDPYYTRHVYGSYSLAPSAAGGFGFDRALVAEWMGHASPETLDRAYYHPTVEARQHILLATGHRPGEVA